MKFMMERDLADRVIADVRGATDGQLLALADLTGLPLAPLRRIRSSASVNGALSSSDSANARPKYIHSPMTP